jgi:murein DD-endopeptidase MepM/ murein hydrolase activator NlpD
MAADTLTGSSLSPAPAPVEPEVNPWQTVKVKSGDSLSVIFDRLKISPAVLHAIVTASEDTRTLKDILPGQELRLLIEDSKVLSLEYDQDLVTTLQVNNENDHYTSRMIKHQLRKNVLEAEATIDSSLFLAGQDAGLSDNLIMQLVAIYGWDIDFALDIRKGDRFRLIYEEHYKDDVKVSEGPILAAEFVNQDKPYRSVRYTSPDGTSDYFAEDGASMRKAFLRTPLNFTRISSGFSLKRRHPALNSIRAHRGVDYAAPTGTPVKAAGNGTIISIGSNGGYGRSIVIKHGEAYSTLYAHLSKYAKGMKKGTRLKQGQIIGYVGRSGLATGPHLHYEFRVNGVHRNPLTVALPKAESIPKDLLPDFKQQTAPLLAQLDKQIQQGPLMLALQDEDPLEPVTKTDSN